MLSIARCWQARLEAVTELCLTFAKRFPWVRFCVPASAQTGFPAKPFGLSIIFFYYLSLDDDSFPVSGELEARRGLAPKPRRLPRSLTASHFRAWKQLPLPSNRGDTLTSFP
jgi:hypothetical protein